MMKGTPVQPREVEPRAVEMLRAIVRKLAAVDSRQFDQDKFGVRLNNGVFRRDTSDGGGGCVACHALPVLVPDGPQSINAQYMSPHDLFYYVIDQTPLDNECRNFIFGGKTGIESAARNLGFRYYRTTTPNDAIERITLVIDKILTTAERQIDQGKDHADKHD